MRVRGERAGKRRRPASIGKAARVRKDDELDWLRVDDDLRRLNVGDSLWRRIISLNYRRFFNHLCVSRSHRGDGRGRRIAAGITPRSDLLIVQPSRLSPHTLHRFR
jgi:hypothetical protein